MGSIMLVMYFIACQPRDKLIVCPLIVYIRPIRCKIFRICLSICSSMYCFMSKQCSSLGLKLSSNSVKMVDKCPVSKNRIRTLYYQIVDNLKNENYKIHLFRVDENVRPTCMRQMGLTSHNPISSAALILKNLNPYTNVKS